MLVDVDTLLQIDQHGHCCHEGKCRVQDDAKDVQLWRERRGNYNKFLNIFLTPAPNTSTNQLAFVPQPNQINQKTKETLDITLEWFVEMYNVKLLFWWVGCVYHIYHLSLTW